MLLVCCGQGVCDVGDHVMVGSVIVHQGIKDSPIFRADVEDYEVAMSVVPYPAKG